MGSRSDPGHAYEHLSVSPEEREGRAVQASLIGMFYMLVSRKEHVRVYNLEQSRNATHLLMSNIAFYRTH